MATEAPVLEVSAIPHDPSTAVQNDENVPEVLVQIENLNNDHEAGNGSEDIAEMEIIGQNALKKGAYVPPAPPVIPEAPLSVVPAPEGGCYVRLMLSIGAAGSTIAPGLEIDDCGVCTFCADKPKFGGLGTKRQKCELKQNEANFNTNIGGVGSYRVWATMHVITNDEVLKMKQIESMPLPEILVQAAAEKPIPVVWAYRRKRRARTLPPAYVLMYYCEGRVPLDRTELANSRQRYFKNARAEGAVVPRTFGANAAKKPRPSKQRVMVDAEPVYGDMHEDGDQSYSMDSAMAAQMQMHSWPQAPVVAGCPLAYGAPMDSHPPMQQPPHAYPGAMPSYQVFQPPSHAMGMPMPAMATASGPIMYPPQPVHASSPGLAPPFIPSMPYGHDAQQADNGHLAEQPKRRRGKKRAADAGNTAMQPGLGEVVSYPNSYYAQDDMHMPDEMRAETDSWFGLGMQHDAPDALAAHAQVDHAAAACNAPPQSAPSSSAPAGDDAAMSNKTLDAMLSRLQDQLAPSTYEEVIKLVRDVQSRRMSLSRSEFLQHFTAICAKGAAAPK